MYVPVNAGFFFCVLLVFPSIVHLGDRFVGLRLMNHFCCVTNTYNTIFPNTKIKQSLLPLIHIKIKICKNIKFKKSRHSACETSTYTLQCELAKKQYSVLLDLGTEQRLP
jgi:hypothetical protein